MERGSINKTGAKSYKKRTSWKEKIIIWTQKSIVKSADGAEWDEKRLPDN